MMLILCCHITEKVPINRMFHSHRRTPGDDLSVCAISHYLEQATPVIPMIIDYITAQPLGKDFPKAVSAAL